MPVNKPRHSVAAQAADDEPTVMPTGRFEWERVVRRIVMPKPHKLLALVLATYSDPDGSRVRPGNDTLAAVTGDSEKNVRRIMAVLRGMDLLQLVARGGGRSGRGKAAEYRLTIPVDLLERVRLLDPADRPQSPDIQTSGQSWLRVINNPVDNSDRADIQVSGGSSAASAIDRTSDVPSMAIDRTSGAIDRTPGCPPTTHRHHPPGTTHLGRLPTGVLTAREPEVCYDARPRRTARPVVGTRRVHRFDNRIRFRHGTNRPTLSTHPIRSSRPALRPTALACLAPRRRSVPILRIEHPHRGRSHHSVVCGRQRPQHESAAAVPTVQPPTQQLPNTGKHPTAGGRTLLRSLPGQSADAAIPPPGPATAHPPLPDLCRRARPTQRRGRPRSSAQRVLRPLPVGVDRDERAACPVAAAHPMTDPKDPTR